MWRVMLGICVLVLPYATAQDVATGRFLVANESLADPNFAETVVLIVQHDDDQGTLGLIVNRRTDVPLSKLFPDGKAVKDPVYIGGPVEKSVAQAAMRLSVKTEGAIRVLGDVYVTGDKALIEKSLAAGTDSSNFRVYVGYAGWAAGQLELEIESGAWTVVRGGVSTVFDDNPDSLWMRMNRELQRQVAHSSHKTISNSLDEVAFARPARSVGKEK